MNHPEYPKIQSVFMRDPDTHKFTREFTCEEFEYLRDIRWQLTEKVDGTNIRVCWDGTNVSFRGRTDNADIPKPLLEALQKEFTEESLRACFPDPCVVTLYGEGYGSKIQKSGHLYRKTPGFVLFDVRVGDWWLKYGDVLDISAKLDIDVVPIVGYYTLDGAVQLVKGGIKSAWGDFQAEGVVAVPLLELKDRAGKRIITKVKTRDFN